MYIIAIVVAFIGLWLSSEVRADGLCGIRSSGVFSVESFDVPICGNGQSGSWLEC
jgi:hypothetical protein